MKTNPFNGIDLSNLPQYIPDSSLSYSLNIVANDMYLQRRNGIAWISHSAISDDRRILTASTISIYGCEGIAYLILDKPSANLYMTIHMFHGVEDQYRQINIPIDEKLNRMLINFDTTYQYLSSKIICAQFKNEVGLILSMDGLFVENVNMYMISYDAATNTLDYSKKIPVSSISKNIHAFSVSPNNSSIAFMASDKYKLSQITINYEQSTGKVASLQSTKVFDYMNEYGKINAIIPLSKVTLVGADNTILKITASTTSQSGGATPVVSYGLSVSVFNAGILKNAWCITNQNTLFCYGKNKRFHNFPIEIFEDGDAIFVKNQQEYQYSVQIIDAIGRLVYADAIRIFKSNRYGLLEIVYGSNISNVFSNIASIMQGASPECSEYFPIDRSRAGYTILFDPAKSAAYPIKRAELMIASANNNGSLQNNRSSFPDYMNRWYSNGALEGIHSDPDSVLNKEYYDAMANPLENIETPVFPSGTYSTDSNDIFLGSIDSSTIFYQSEMIKADILYSDNNDPKQQHYFTVILLSKCVDDIEESLDVRSRFVLWFNNSDGFTVKISPLATYMVGTHALETPTTFSNANFYLHMNKMDINTPSVRCNTSNSSRYSGNTGIAFITRGQCIDAIIGISLSKTSRLAKKPSHL